MKPKKKLNKMSRAELARLIAKSPMSKRAEQAARLMGATRELELLRQR